MLPRPIDREAERPPRPDVRSGPAPACPAGVIDAAFRALPVGLAVHDEWGRCVLANPAAASLSPSSAADQPCAPRGTGGEPILAQGAAQGSERAVEILVQPFQDGPDLYTLTSLVDVTSQHRLQRDLLKRAYIDTLTGLPNRALLEQTVEDLIVSASPGDTFALAFIDLDNFKHINDYYSHAAGDALLTKVAERISGSLRGTDMLARVGGDEFVLVLSPMDDIASMKAFVTRMAERLKEPFFIDGHEVFASASIGVSLFPEHGLTYDVLRRQADSAMYRVKGGTKGGVGFFEESMAQAATARMAVEQRLRLAIRDRCFTCAYQPKADIRTGAVHGVEVLLRWRDEQGVIQAPGAFIGLAIELGLINDIAFQVLAQTAASLPEIDARFGQGVSISLNVAAKQASDIAFMSDFVAALTATGQAERFILEITEEAFFTKGTFQMEVLPRIRAVGARVSIDDFGVGYSSLAALAEITADELKIDRSFIKDIHLRPRSQIVLRAIESIGQALGMTLIAEGVETFEEVAYLQAATQIRYAQGYYFARPVVLEREAEGGRMMSARDVAAFREAFRPRASRSGRGA